MSSIEYSGFVVKNVEEHAKKRKFQLPKKAVMPIDNSFVPELDETKNLDSTLHTYYQESIGMLRCNIVTFSSQPQRRTHRSVVKECCILER